MGWKRGILAGCGWHLAGMGGGDEAREWSGLAGGGRDGNSACWWSISDGCRWLKIGVVAPCSDGWEGLQTWRCGGGRGDHDGLWIRPVGHGLGCC